jgi:outer membrane protein
MRAALSILVLSLLAATSTPVAAQDRIAYANIAAILSLMPETKSAAQGVDTLGRKLASDLDVKEAYAKQRYEEAQKAAAKGATEQELETFRKELRDLEDQIRKGSEDADTKMAQHKAELMQPVLEKLEKTIKEVAKAEGYTYVLNTVDGNGNSIVLYGQEDRDITKKILTKLGIPIPKDEPKSTSKTEPSKTAPPKGGTPSAGTPKTEAPKTEPPKTEAPKTEAKTDPPKTDGRNDAKATARQDKSRSCRRRRAAPWNPPPPACYTRDPSRHPAPPERRRASMNRNALRAIIGPGLPSPRRRRPRPRPRIRCPFPRGKTPTLAVSPTGKPVIAWDSHRPDTVPGGPYDELYFAARRRRLVRADVGGGSGGTTTVRTSSTRRTAHAGCAGGARRHLIRRPRAPRPGALRRRFSRSTIRCSRSRAARSARRVPTRWWWSGRRGGRTTTRS